MLAGVFQSAHKSRLTDHAELCYTAKEKEAIVYAARRKKRFSD